MAQTLTLVDATVISQLVKAALEEKYLIFTRGCKTFPGIERNFYAMARAIMADERGSRSLDEDQDVRDGYLWLTAGREHYVPFSTVLDDLRDGLAVVVNVRPVASEKAAR